MKKSLFFFLLTTLIISSCTRESRVSESSDIERFFPEYITELPYLKEKLDEESLHKFYETFTPEERIAQLFLVSLDGNQSNQVERIVSINKCAPGGYLLFAFNIADSSEETIIFLSDIRNAYLGENEIPPFIAIDHEGGMVNRLRNICSKLPSQLSVAQKFTVGEAQHLYELHGLQLRNLGIQVNLAPVVEILTEENSSFLENRSFGSKEDVIKYSSASIRGMIKAGILPVMKHFPGNTNSDPHSGMPVLSCSSDEFKEMYINPFFELAKGRNTGILAAHTVVPVIDEKPACLSQIMIDLLKSDENAKESLIFSDDLLMKALINNGYPIEKSLIEAINAGVNILMISTGRFDEYAGIILEEYEKDESFKAKVDQSVMKILEWKISNGLLERNVYQTGFFEYEAEICLPDFQTVDEVETKKKEFSALYEEASIFYDDIWWSR